MDFPQYRFLVRSDLYRITGMPGGNGFIRNLLGKPGFRYCFLLRSCPILGVTGS